jgi:hypothetical protein
MAKKKSSMREKAKKKAEKSLSRGGNRMLNTPEGTEFLKIKDKGPYHLDILPYIVSVDTHPEAEKGEQWYQRTYFSHYGIGPEEKAVVCPKTIKKPCPICEHVKELYNSDDESDRKLAGEIKAKERELYNVIDLNDQDKGVQLFEMSYHNFGKALDEEIQEGDEELGDFAELEGGLTLVTTFRKKKLGQNTFFEARKIEFEEREEYDESILEDVYDLDTLFTFKSYEELQKELFGLADVEEAEEPEEEAEEKPKRKFNKAGKKSGKKKVEEEPEEDPYRLSLIEELEPYTEYQKDIFYKLIIDGQTSMSLAKERGVSEAAVKAAKLKLIKKFRKELGVKQNG